MTEEQLCKLWTKLTHIYGDLCRLEVPPELAEVYAARDAVRRAMNCFHFSGPEHEISGWVERS